jgi:hypothetical protein
VTPTISYEGGQRPAFAKASQNVAVVATLLNTLLPASAVGVDKLYQHLGEILAIIAVR